MKKKIIVGIVALILMVSTSLAYAVSAPTAATVFSKSYTALSKPVHAPVQIDVLTPLLAKPASATTDLTGVQSAAILKRVRALVALPAKPTSGQISNQSVYIFKKNISLTAGRGLLASILPYAKQAKLGASGLTAFTSPIKNFSLATIEVKIDQSSYYPVVLTIKWQTAVKKNTQIVRSPYSVTLNFSGFTAVKKIAPANTTASGTADVADTVIVSAPDSQAVTHAVDASGQGGVTSQRVNNFSVVPGRDAARLADLKAFQLALELFFNDQGSYPAGNGIVLGGNATNCLNADGWGPVSDCPYPYMANVPSDPKGDAYQYLYFGSDNSYKITATLESVSVSAGLQGKIVLTPSGLANQ